MAGAEREPDSARATLRALRDGGDAARRFAALVEAQGGDPAVLREPGLLPAAAVVETLDAPEGADHWVAGVDARTVGEAALALGAGRRAKTDTLDLGVGVRLRRKTGERVAPGEPLAEIHARSAGDARAAAALLRTAYSLQPRPVETATPAPEVVDAG
jgi:pyrimidine-nucleoside phosphorylase